MYVTSRCVRFLIVVACFCSPAIAAEKLPNVVFFLVDDLGWRDLGCYGSPFYETPHIDRFAKESVRFSEAYATCHVCSPTRASIMTGKYPATLHLTDWLPGRKEFPFQKLKNVATLQHLPFAGSDNGGMSAANFGRPDRVIPDSQLDKAYSTSNLPLRGAKGWLYEGGIRVPMMVKWPSQGNRGTTCDVPVTSTDFYPSILAMIGVAARPEQHQDGVSFAPLLKGQNRLDREAIYWHFPHYSNHGMQSPGGAIRCGDYKLLEYFENNTVQLFNLREDLGEHNDLATAEPEVAARLKSMLHRWRAKVGAQMMEPNPDYGTVP